MIESKAQVGEEIEAKVEKLVAGGDGLAFHEGMSVFIPLSAPGDRVRARLVERRKNYARAEIVEILEGGPARRTPPCRFFDRCGGCDLQHIEDEEQPRIKARAFGETLKRLAGITFENSIDLVTGSAWGYRLRTQIHWRSQEGKVTAGYHGKKSHEIIPVDACPVLVPELEALLPDLPESLSSIDSQESGPVLSLCAGDQSIAADPVLPITTGPSTEVTAGGSRFLVDGRTFFQGHRGLLDNLQNLAVGEEQGKLAADLYCGVGFFSVPLAQRYGKVLGIEESPEACRYARRNARNTTRGNLKIFRQTVESWVQDLPVDIDRVLMDPPRAGLPGKVRQALLETRPPHLTYVSCHPAALARDLKALLEVYRIDSLSLLDLFPQTSHLEAVVQLVRT